MAIHARADVAITVAVLLGLVCFVWWRLGPPPEMELAWGTHANEPLATFRGHLLANGAACAKGSIVEAA